MSSKSLQEHKDRMADYGCVLCHVMFGKQTPALLHHPREGTGGGRRASDWLVVPLCQEHHVGKTGVHGMGTKAFARKYGSEYELLRVALKAVYGRDGWPAKTVDELRLLQR